MKKIFILTSLVSLLVACETKYYSVLVSNESSKTVSYTYNDSSDTLAAKTSNTYEVLAYTQPPKNINVAEKTTAKIYTSTPKFTSLIDYPVIIDWNFNDNTVYVNIR